MREPTQKLSITFTAPQLAYLREQSAKMGISVPDLVRRIIDQHRGAGDA